MHRFLILIEPTESGFSAYSPDVPGCIATGHTAQEVEAKMREAIALHLDGLRADGQPVPAARTTAVYVEVAA